MRLDAKTPKTNADKAQLFAESVERHFGIHSNNFESNHFDEVSQFIEDNYEYFYPPEDPDDYRSDMDDDHDLVVDIDSDTLIRIVKFLKRGKTQAQITYTMRYLARHHHLIVSSLSTAFYLLHTNRLHPNCMEVSYPSYVTET